MLDGFIRTPDTDLAAASSGVLGADARPAAGPARHWAKLAVDLAGAALLLVLVAPVMLLAVLALAWQGGPVFVAHRRVGHGGRVFGALKFRVMAAHAGASPADASTAGTRPAGDPRLTGLGRFLRRTCLEELPQLINVLRLEMSLVGPSPIAPAEASRYGADLAWYCAVRPGITGLWQISGRGGVSFYQRVRLDSWYVKNWTPRQDAAILLKTMSLVLPWRGIG